MLVDQVVDGGGLAELEAATRVSLAEDPPFARQITKAALAQGALAR